MRVIIMRGIPGAGKSTYVQKQIDNGVWKNATVFSADHYFMKGGRYEFAASQLPEAHKQCLKIFVCRLWADVGRIDSPGELIVDNTNCTRWEYMPYYQIANAFGYPVEIIRVTTPSEVAGARNIHGVPPKKVTQMAIRIESVLPWQRETIVEGV